NMPTGLLSGSGTGTFSWVASGGGNITGGAGTSSPTVNAGGTYTLTTTATNGCTATDNVIVTGDFLAPIAGSGSASTIDCNTPSTVLSGTGGGTYSWIASGGGNIVSGGTTATPTVDAGGNYTVTVTSPNGCTDTDLVVITGDFTLPTASGGSVMVIDCNNTTVILSGSGGGTYSWLASAGGTISVGGSTATPTATSSGTYTVTVTATNGCIDTDFTNVTTDLSTPTATIAVPTMITCTVTSVILDASGSSGTGGLSYAWVASAGGNIVSGGTTSNPTVNAAGDYTVTVTQPNGCTDILLVTVIADSNVPVANAGTAIDLNCTVGIVILDGSGSTSSGGLSYNWIASGGGNIVSGAGTAAPTVDAAGTYTLTVTDAASGCTSIDVIVVNENILLPTASILPPITIDCNNPTILIDGAGSSQGAGFSYNWTTVGGNMLTSTANDSVTVDASGDYTLTVTNTINNCLNVMMVTVVVDTTSPLANAGPNQTLTCAAVNVTLDETGSIGGITYSWSGPGITAGGSTATATANIPGTYLLTISGSNGCTDTNSVQVIPDANLPVADAGIDLVIDCNNLTVNLDGSGSETGASITYLWSTTGGNIVSGGSSTSPTVNAAGTYTITVENTSNGCSSISLVTVTTDTLPPTAVASTLNNLDCNTTQVALVATITTGTAASYQWSTTTGNIVSGSNADTVVVDAAGSYTLIVTGANGCSSVATLTTVSSSTGPTAFFTASPDSGSMPLNVTFTNLSSGGVSYGWDFGDGETDSIFEPSHIYNSTGTFTATLTVTDTNGCTDTFIITIIVEGEFIIEVPNVFTPNGDGINDHFHPITQNAKALECVVYNRWGQYMYEWWTLNGGWDGRTTAGTFVPEGTYYYIMKVTDYQEVVHEFTGFFVLQR
ncbi:MAG: PKD domain-containing protein, partial [Flavobacteriales bacterium]|nr:PKD domain-containing protein [Flavobacteriales bacterium]